MDEQGLVAISVKADELRKRLLSGISGAKLARCARYLDIAARFMDGTALFARAYLTLVEKEMDDEKD